MKAQHMDRDDALKAAHVMEDMGGSFAAHIARAFYAADSHNAKRIVAAFPEIFEKYYQYHLDMQARGHDGI
jgi:predicted RNA polymerase sigma factor